MSENNLVQKAELRILEIRKQLSKEDIEIVRAWRNDDCFDLEHAMQDKVLGLELRQLIESLDEIEMWKDSHNKLNQVKSAVRLLKSL